MPNGSPGLAECPAALARLKYEMRELFLAAVTSIALTGVAQAEIGLNLQTYEQCAGLLRAIAREAEWSKSAEWYEAVSDAFVLAAAEERIKNRGEVPNSLQIELEARAVQESLDQNLDATGQPTLNNPELFDFCIDIGEAIIR